MIKLNRWYRRRRFLTAYKILRNEAERHTAAGHDMDFKAVNESFISMICNDCSDSRPPKPKVK